jgi:outer membrane protein
MGCKHGGWSLLLIFLIMVLCSTSALSEENTLTLTLEESIALALQESVLIHSARENVNASESERKGALTQFMPTLNTKYYYTRLNEKPSTTIPGLGTFQTGTKNNYTWEVEVTQPIFAGGKIYSNYQINSLGVDVSKMKESRSIEDVVELVKTYYFNILKSERILDVAKQAVEQLKAHRDTAKSFYDVGLIPKNDLLYAEVELANGKQDLLKAENGVQLAKAQFNTILRRSVSDPVEVRDILDYSPYDLVFDECLKTAFKNRSEITEYELVVQQARKAVNLAGSDFYPSVNVIGNYSKYGDEPDVSGSKYSDQEDWRVVAMLNWNLWAWGRTRHAVNASRNKVSQAEDALLDLKDRISLDVMNSFLNLRESEKRIFVARTAIEQAEENFRINEERYKEQVATSTDVIDAQTLLTKTKSDYYSALSDYKIAVGKLERSMGVGYVSPKDPESGK